MQHSSRENAASDTAFSALLGSHSEAALHRARHAPTITLQVPVSGSVLVELPVTPSTPEHANANLLLDPRVGFITEISDISGDASERQSVEDYFVQDPSEEGSLRLSLSGADADVLEETRSIQEKAELGQEIVAPEQEDPKDTTETALKDEERMISQEGVAGKPHFC